MISSTNLTDGAKFLLTNNIFLQFRQKWTSLVNRFKLKESNFITILQSITIMFGIVCMNNLVFYGQQNCLKYSGLSSEYFKAFQHSFPITSTSNHQGAILSMLKNTSLFKSRKLGAKCDEKQSQCCTQNWDVLGCEQQLNSRR